MSLSEDAMFGPVGLSRAEALAPVVRWTPKRKKALLAAVIDRVVELSDALAAHAISPEEFTAWLDAYAPLRSLAVRRVYVEMPGVNAVGGRA